MRQKKTRRGRRLARVLIASSITLAIIALLTFVTVGRDVPVLNTHGTIADQQYVLILIIVALGVFVVVPVFILLFTIAWKYRATNTAADYEPELEGNKKLEALWWGIPIFIIVVLAVITWVSTHALDPYKPLTSEITPVNVQVVSLERNWLFIYPDYQVATVNYMNIPKDTPVNLTITSDAPMNTFWVPALAGQVYTMSGMSTKLHLMADTVGTFNGATSNISGEGYADLTFKVKSIGESEFEQWARQAASDAPQLLTATTYAPMPKQERIGEATMRLETVSLYDDIVMKYMHAGSEEH